MLNLIKAENLTTFVERKFDSWMAQVESQLGYKLEDDDQAWSLFFDGCDVEDAVVQLKD